VAVAPHFQLLLKELEAHPQVGEARGIGLMGALELVANKQTKAPFPPEQTVSEDIANVALEHGLICRPIGQAIVLAPPFIITRAQIDELFEKLRKTLEHVLGRQATDAGA
jgi:adenosylmethionine-8-amino-7-oxononanoate aminotransferase